MKKAIGVALLSWVALETWNPDWYTALKAELRNKIEQTKAKHEVSEEGR